MPATDPRIATFGNRDEEKDQENRKILERRAKESDGYMYISTVGWICRREKCRRECDKLET